MLQSSDLLSTVFARSNLVYLIWPLIVSLKISSSISSAILKPLIVPERGREEARSQCDVYLTFSTGSWLSGLLLLAEHIGLPALAIGHHLLDAAFLHPRSHKSQQCQMGYPNRIRGVFGFIHVLVSCICLLWLYLLWMHSCASVLLLSWRVHCEFHLNPGPKWFLFSNLIIHIIQWFLFPLQRSPPWGLRQWLRNQ